MLYDVKAVAALLKVSVPYVYKLSRSGKLVTVRIGAALRFRPEDVTTFIESCITEQSSVL